MPQIKANKTLPTAIMPTPKIEFSFNEETNELEFTGSFPMDYPEEAVINRYGRAPKDEKGNLTGEPKPVTQKTYGLGHKIFAGASDGDNNPMFVNIRLFAPTKEADEAESGEAED